jgi:molecular chaperone GrpE
MENIADLYSSFEDNEETKTASEKSEVKTEIVATATESDCVETVEQQETVTQEKVEEVPADVSNNSNELLEIKTLLVNLSEQFESKLKYDKHKEEIIDKLHAENQAYKNDLFKKIISPFVNEVIFLIDDYANLFKKHSGTDIAEIDTVKLLRQFGSISGDLEELLNKNGIESFTVADDAVDFAKQKIIKTVSTEIQEKDKTVCERIKKGFIMDGKIIRQELVSCYKFENKNINN